MKTVMLGLGVRLGLLFFLVAAQLSFGHVTLASSATDDPRRQPNAVAPARARLDGPFPTKRTS